MHFQSENIIYFRKHGASFESVVLNAQKQPVHVWNKSEVIPFSSSPGCTLTSDFLCWPPSLTKNHLLSMCRDSLPSAVIREEPWERTPKSKHDCTGRQVTDISQNCRLLQSNSSLHNFRLSTPLFFLNILDNTIEFHIVLKSSAQGDNTAMSKMLGSQAHTHTHTHLLIYCLLECSDSIGRVPTGQWLMMLGKHRRS